MLQGLMQDKPLNVIDILRFASVAHADREIVSRNIDEPIWRYNYANAWTRAAQAANMLTELDVTPGDRVSSLAWNTQRHFELFFAVPGIGAVLHTANPRLPDEHLIYTINHAGSKVLLMDADMIPIYERIKPQLTTVEHAILLSDGPRTPMGWVGYEESLAKQSEHFDWQSLDENSGAFLCYTSGTTGDPKGVLYSHRSTVLHAIAAGLSGALNFSAFDVVMPCQSLYHATAWGLPFAGAINGVKFVFPCDKFDGASLQTLITEEKVTFSGGVPTIWTMYLKHLANTGETTGSLDRVIIGGSAVPHAMAVAFNDHGVKVQQIWGMTETSPLGVVASETPALLELGQDAANEVIWTRQGRMMFGIEMKIVDDDGKSLPHNGESAGALMVRGPWVLKQYFRAETAAVDDDAWFDTGDICTIDQYGFMRITDRKKDVIKSGGEWISSIDLENIAAGHPGVKIAAVVGVYHPKWEERPILVVEPSGAAVDPGELEEWLASRVVKWWMPDKILVEDVPLTATGKIDKKTIRDRHGNILVGTAR